MKQNLIMSEQLLLMQESIKTQSSFISRIFNCAFHTSMNNQRVDFDLFNKGGVASNITVMTLGSFGCEISKNILLTNEFLTLTITAQDLSRIDGGQIKITCNDRMDKSHSLLFRYDFHRRSLTKEEDEPR